MSDLMAQNLAAQTAPAAPAAAPAAPPVAASPALPMPEPKMPDGGSFEDGGSTGGVKGFFQDVNLLDAAISAFVIGTLMYTIHYFKFHMELEKMGYADLSSRIARLEAAEAKRQAELNAIGRMKRRPILRLT